MAPNNYPSNERERGGGYPQDNRGGHPSAPTNGARAPEQHGGEGLVPIGDVPVIAVNHKFGRASTGTRQIGVRCRITDGEHKGKTLLWYGSFTDNSIAITMRGMRALGHTGRVPSDCDGFYAPNVTPAMAVVEHNPDNDGKLRARIAFINGGDIVMKQEMDANELAAFDREFAGYFARLGGGGSSAAPPPARAAAPPPRGQPPRDDRRPPPEQRPNPAPGREYGQSYGGPPRGAAPPQTAAGNPWDPPARHPDDDIPY
jgi:hypothetical protein